MNSESGEIKGTEFQHGLTPIETVVAIETLINDATYPGKYIEDGTDLLCNNCGYSGTPYLDYIERSGRRKPIPVCPICGERSWPKLVQLIAKIRQVLDMCFEDVDEEFCADYVDAALEGLE